MTFDFLHLQAGAEVWTLETGAVLCFICRRGVRQTAWKGERLSVAELWWAGCLAMIDCAGHGQWESEILVILYIPCSVECGRLYNIRHFRSSLCQVC